MKYPELESALIFVKKTRDVSSNMIVFLQPIFEI